MPDGDADFSTRWAAIKARFTHAYLTAGGTEAGTSPRRKRGRAVWQERFWEHTIRDETDLNRHLDYIHYNPVKHGLAGCPHAWPHSSFDRTVRQQLYERNWLCSCEGRTPIIPNFADLASVEMD